MKFSKSFLFLFSEPPKEKELVDYLSSRGEILYSDLIKDEISKVDLLLVKDSKKEGQIGGKFFH